MDKQLIIKRCILRSKYILLAKASRTSIKNTIFYLNRIPILFPTQNKLKDLDSETRNVINEFKRYIAQQLRYLFKEKGIEIEDEYWFSGADLKNGYILLDKNKHSEVPSHVLFLSPSITAFDNKIIKEGDILPFMEVDSILMNVKSVDNGKESVAIRRINKQDKKIKKNDNKKYKTKTFKSQDKRYQTG